MKLNIHCNKCFLEEELGFPFVEVDIKDDGLYSFTCLRKHSSLVYLTNQKYEVLFDIGVMALIDGYTRECVASIAASLERFYEFYIRVIQTKYEIPYTEIEATWKLVASQSERQLGAFVYMYLIENKKTVALLSNNKINFRNNVIHKGYIPTFEEAKEYGEAVLNFIKNILNELKSKNSAYIKKIIDDGIKSNLSKRKENDQCMSMQITTTFISSTPLDCDLASTTFEEAFKRLSIVSPMQKG